jgi:hypothetical protein
MGIEFKPIAKKHECKDGATLSIQASKSHYCTPRDNKGPYSSIEVGFIQNPGLYMEMDRSLLMYMGMCL